MFRKLCILGLAATFFSIPGVASANPGDFETVFEFTGSGGAISDFAVQWFAADPTDLATSWHLDGDLQVPGAADIDLTNPLLFLELEITGLSHDSPMDLNIFLLDPFGTGIEIMDDRGDQVALDGATLFFWDKGTLLPTDPDPLISGTKYAPELPGNPGGLQSYTTTGNEEWRLVVIDDSGGDEGTFESFTLRGLVVPEPATLSLLAIGACALLRRRKA